MQLKDKEEDFNRYQDTHQLTLDDYYKYRKLDKDEALIVRSLLYGKENAIKAPVLAKDIGIDERVLRDAIRHLRQSHGLRIGTSLEKPAGYYLIRTKEEARETSGQLWSRVIDMLKTIKVIEGASLLELEGQLRLRMEGE